jgi:hypothetical protein
MERAPRIEAHGPNDARRDRHVFIARPTLHGRSLAGAPEARNRLVTAFGRNDLRWNVEIFV